MRRTDAKDSKKRFFRAGDRIVSQNGAWFFTAREGDIGPFQTRAIAEREVDRFLSERLQLSNFQRSRKAAPKPVPKVVAKPAALRNSSVRRIEQTRHHLDQKVESDGMLLTLDDDLLL